MAFSDWRAIKKIDAHIHIIPDAVHRANPDSDDVWRYAELHRYCGRMDALHIEKAVIMPLNDPWLMSMEFTVDAVHRNLRDMKRAYPGRFCAFADVDTRNSPRASVEAIVTAIDSYGLDGVKLHPNNTGVALDDAYNAPILALAQARGIPVAVHSYPNTEDDVSAASRVVKMAERYPGLKLIVSHMGAFQWERLLPLDCYVDMSAILPDYVRVYGLEKTNAILRAFGTARLLFATDDPDSRCLRPGEIYDTYFDILNRMDFTPAEAARIAYTNANELFF